MKNRVLNIVLGFFFIVIGIGFAGNAFHFWNFDLFFDGWWTLFIIIPSAISLLKGQITSGLVGLAIGGLLLLSAQDIIQWGTIVKLIVPLVLVLIGCSIIFKGRFNNISNEIRRLSTTGQQECVAVFSGQQMDFSDQQFHGTNATAIFGGIDIFLKNAIITEDTVIEATCIFGGIDIVVPNNVIVKVSSVPIFGGVSNKTYPIQSTNLPTIYVKATCIFGGIEIK